MFLAQQPLFSEIVLKRGSGGSRFAWLPLQSGSADVSEEFVNPIVWRKAAVHLVDGFEPPELRLELVLAETSDERQGQSLRLWMWEVQPAPTASQPDS